MWYNSFEGFLVSSLVCLATLLYILGFTSQLHVGHDMLRNHLNKISLTRVGAWGELKVRNMKTHKNNRQKT